MALGDHSRAAQLKPMNHLQQRGKERQGARVSEREGEIGALKYPTHSWAR